MNKEFVVDLTPKQRKHLIKVVSVGKNKAAVIRRAHILLKSAEGKTAFARKEILLSPCVIW